MGYGVSNMADIFVLPLSLMMMITIMMMMMIIMLMIFMFTMNSNIANNRMSVNDFFPYAHLSN